MIRIIGKLPQDNLGLALSGGVDSMTIAQFLLNGRRNFTAFHFNHGTDYADEAEQFVSNWCADNDVPLIVKQINHRKPIEGTKVSMEEWWRNNRYQFFHDYLNYTIITAHHLNDCMETYLFSCLHGNPKVIPYRRKNVIRPFLLTERKELVRYAKRYNLKWCDDPSNESCDYMRNRIRKNIMPEVLKVNPGLHKVVGRFVEQTVEKENVYED